MIRSNDVRRRRLTATPVVGTAGLAVVMLMSLTAQEPGQTGGFTAAQATSGGEVYERVCASCHRTDFQGSFEAPPLAGANFLNLWGDLSAAAMFDRISASMPPDRPGRLGDQTYVDIVAYLLQANGAGSVELTATTAASITTLATSRAAPTEVRAAQGGGQTRRPQGRSRDEPAGLRVTGTVPNFRRVTEEMLRSPSPDDWLMIRGNYEAWSYSPLDEITRDNVQDLKLAWIWSMGEGGWNAPSPIVHDGVVYVTNYGNVVQALDGRTGDLIWEHEVGAEARTYSGTSRNLAVYDDKVFLATSDARMVALDAATGEMIWVTRFGDNAQGHQSTSGPIVVGREDRARAQRV